ncbi:MAG: flagellar type III secretion system protein FlhB [Alphaproteobacteria bacterium]|nr:flagellar type III secretion system protein FlhB [Alphaproteobacteria bacterium]
MAEESEKDDRTEEPTAHKLQEARKRGDIVFTPEVGAAMSLFAAAGVLAFFSGPLSARFAHALTGYLANAAHIPVDGPSLMRVGADVALNAMAALALAALGFSFAAIAARYVQDQPTFTAQKLKPSIDKLDPIKGFSRVFGAQAFAQFLKTLAKFVIVGAAMASALWPHDATFEMLSMVDPGAWLPFVRERALSLVLLLAFAAAVIAGVDYIFARQSYIKRQRMTRRELKEEFRQQEGDPMVRAKLRQIRAERSKKRMLANMPNATVVVTNPTHYAVALRYVQDETPAPICLAKGVDDVAMRIREAAEAHDVPIVEDPPLARALFAAADIDAPIPREHYEAVAKVIGVVLRLAARRRRPAPGSVQRDANR